MKNDLIPNLPTRIGGLADLAYNLWWSWHPEARELWRALDLQAYRESGHNPVRILSLISREAIERAAGDAAFLSLYDRVMKQFRRETEAPPRGFPGHPEASSGPVAYFSAEFGVHVSLPVYAGGLGILAGDTLKEASDLGLPLVGVGLIYSHGYVRQWLRDDGWQEEIREPLDTSVSPLRRATDREGNVLLVPIPLFDPPIYVGYGGRWSGGSPSTSSPPILSRTSRGIGRSPTTCTPPTSSSGSARRSCSESEGCRPCVRWG